MNKVRVGIIGCGAIAPQYLRNLRDHFSELTDVVACADTVAENAQSRAGEFGVPRACSPAELLAIEDIEVVVNLTPAPAHHAVSLSILEAGKHLFSEKPLALTREHARELLDVAAARRLRIAGAADTFLGGSLQYCRRIIDSGRIGTPLAAQVLVCGPFFHMERYHSVFRGALLDLGPYYITALVALLAPVRRVAGAAEIRFREKPYAPDSPQAGGTFAVDIPTTVSAAMDLADGTVVSLIASGDVHGYFPRVEIFGTAGTLILNDANMYFGPVTVRTRDGEDTCERPPGFIEPGRALGVAEMALALRENREPRASGALMYHVLDAMLAVHESSSLERHVSVQSTAARPDEFDAAVLPRRA